MFVGIGTLLTKTVTNFVAALLDLFTDESGDYLTDENGDRLGE
jgi:hypothetical protein